MFSRNCLFAAERNLDSLLACVATEDGRVLWHSPLWFNLGNSSLEGTGTRWQEFMHPDDLPAKLQWLADRTENRHTFRALCPSDGIPMTVTSAKFRIRCNQCERPPVGCIRANGHWLVVAVCVESEPFDLPAGPCSAGDADAVIHPRSGIGSFFPRNPPDTV